MTILVENFAVRQPDVYVPPFRELHVSISSLSLGGAERIVLDWAQRIYPQWRVHLIVLRDRAQEWLVPSHVRVTRLGGVKIPHQLEKIGRTIAQDLNPVCVCHLLSTKERSMLAKAGAFVVPVFHNARNGWVEGVDHLANIPYVVAVSQSCADELREDGLKGTVSVIRHIPHVVESSPDVREEIRRVWNIPQGAFVIGMIGAIKPQKNYVFALEIFAEFLQRQDAYLVIVGGPVNTGIGYDTWKNVVDHVCELGLRHRVAMPGFVPDATRFLSAFDVFLNSSHFEGMSIATLESILSGIPVVASHVGGQGEVMHDALTLIPISASPQTWADALVQASKMEVKKPLWADFPSHRLWTLTGLARAMRPSSKTLFVTANLSAGGAQRSLVNLTKELHGRLDFEIMVAGKSSATYFLDDLLKMDIKVMRASTNWNVFDFAEAIAVKIVSEGFSTICFWNVDARVKLLLAKAFEFGGPRFIDVSPGGHSFEEMGSFQEFQQLIAFTNDQYLGRLDRLVLKYEAEPVIGCEEKTVVIRNGIPFERNHKRNYIVDGHPRIVVSGRIAPTKFLVEIVIAMKALWKNIPDAELHVIGAAEHYHTDYYHQLLEEVGYERDVRVFFHGQCFDVIKILPTFDVYVVLGKNQGCPNALLEAMMAGLPVVGNDDGGTREQLIHNHTGLLIQSQSFQELAGALYHIITDRELARRLGEAGRKHVEKNFSMASMSDGYLALFNNLSHKKSSRKATSDKSFRVKVQDLQKMWHDWAFPQKQTKTLPA